MPIILQNSNTHAFSYEDSDGVRHEVTVKRGQDIEPHNIPAKRLARLLSEQVVVGGESRRPRYVVKEQADLPTRSYTEGVTSTAKREAQIARKQTVAAPSENPMTVEEQTALLRAAELAEAAEQQDDLREAAELAQASAEQAALEAAGQKARAEAAEAELAKLRANAATVQASEKAPAAPARRGRPPAAK